MNAIDYQKIFAANLLKRIEELGLSKVQLAKDADLSYATVIKVLSCTYNPTLKIMTQLANAAKIPLAHLFLSDKYNETADLPVPQGYQLVQAILPNFQAYKVQKWNEQALVSIRKSR